MNQNVGAAPAGPSMPPEHAGRRCVFNAAVAPSQESAPVPPADLTAAAIFVARMVQYCGRPYRAKDVSPPGHGYAASSTADTCGGHLVRHEVDRHGDNRPDR
ncbi:MAG: hypothetical protein NVS4B6_10570 [Mycobacterium sp.]